MQSPACRENKIPQHKWASKQSDDLLEHIPDAALDQEPGKQRTDGFIPVQPGKVQYTLAEK